MAAYLEISEAVYKENDKKWNIFRGFVTAYLYCMLKKKSILSAPVEVLLRSSRQIHRIIRGILKLSRYRLILTINSITLIRLG
jgi:hypothetical protein